MPIERDTPHLGSGRLVEPEIAPDDERCKQMMGPVFRCALRADHVEHGAPHEIAMSEAPKVPPAFPPPPPPPVTPPHS